MKWVKEVGARNGSRDLVINGQSFMFAIEPTLPYEFGVPYKYPTFIGGRDIPLIATDSHPLPFPRHLNSNWRLCHGGHLSSVDPSERQWI